MRTSHLKSLAELLPDPDKLRLIAAWFDLEHETHPEWTSYEVQISLREWADNIEILLGKVN